MFKLYCREINCYVFRFEYTSAYRKQEYRWSNYKPSYRVSLLPGLPSFGMYNVLISVIQPGNLLQCSEFVKD